jgi:hypothetical protein
VLVSRLPTSTARVGCSALAPPLHTQSSVISPGRALAAERSAASIDAELISLAQTPVGRGLHLLAEHRGADLLVVGSSRHGVLGRVLMGDDARASLNGTPSAVAVAPLGYAHAANRINTIGVGLDASDESKLALRAAREQAARHGAAVHADPRRLARDRRATRRAAAAAPA